MSSVSSLVYPGRISYALPFCKSLQFPQGRCAVGWGREERAGETAVSYGRGDPPVCSVLLGLYAKHFLDFTGSTGFPFEQTALDLETLP